MKRAAGFAVAGFLAFVAACELVMRVLPVPTATLTGYHVDPLFLTYPAGHRWTSATGWDLRNAQTHKANNLGFLAHRDFVPDSCAVALVGDSYVEASMLRPDARLGVQLERLLHGRSVYALGGPGSSLLDYAERIRFVRQRLGVHDIVVFIERADVRQSLCGSGNVQGVCMDRETLAERTWLQPEPGLGKKLLRNSALAQYLAGQLRIDGPRTWEKMVAQARPPEPVQRAPDQATGAAAPPAAGVMPPYAEAVMQRFLERVATPGTGRLVMVFDSDRTALHRGLPTADAVRDRFIELARAAGASVVDTEPLFRAHLARSPLQLDVGPYDAHINGLGFSLVANVVAQVLARPGSQPAACAGSE